MLIRNELKNIKAETTATYELMTARISKYEADAKKIHVTAKQNNEDFKKVVVSIRDVIQPIIDSVNI